MKNVRFLFAVSALLFVAALPSRASQFATGGTETLLGGGAEAVHTFAESGTFTLSRTVEARLLVVAGGGGGGYDCSGGGGGGGVIEVKSVLLKAGTYGVTVGAGGAGGAQTGHNGKNGGDSIVALLDDGGAATTLYQAIGGGGGAAWTTKIGSSGGSGGGGTWYGKGGDGVDGQGHAGGTGTGKGPQGGGGAGAAAVGDAVNEGGRHANGGAGLESDISGATDVYGPGGAAGGYNGQGGYGGDQTPDADGYIWGCGYDNGTKAAIVAAMETAGLKAEGRPAHGGGGGGGNNTFLTGAAGGSGVVIFRIPNEIVESDDPTLLALAPVPSFFSADVSVAVPSAGATSQSGTVELVYQFSDDASDFGEGDAFAGTETIVDAAFAGDATVTIPGLRPLRSYFVRFVARNDAGRKAVSEVFAFATTARDEPRWTTAGEEGGSLGTVVEGLWQVYWSGTSITEAFDETTVGRVAMPGTVIAGVSTKSSNATALYGTSYTAADGTSYSMTSGLSYGYVGYMWLEEGTTYNFFKHWWDSVRFEIEGTSIIRSTTWDKPGYGSYVPERTGWHRLQIWFGGSTGNAGVPDDWSFAFGWNTNGATSCSAQPGAEWSMLDLESGARLMTGRAGRTLSAPGYTVGEDGLEFDVSISAGVAGTLYALWGDAYGAETFAAWAHASALGAVAADAATVTATVPADAAYVRFCLVQEDDIVAWSETAQIDLSSVAITDAGAAHDGDLADLSVRVDSVGEGTFSLRLLYADNEALEGATVVEIPASAAGTYTATIPCTPGAATYYRFEAETSAGGSDATAVASFTTLSASELGSDPTSAVTIHKLTVTVPIAALGAGATTVQLWAGDDADSLERVETVPALAVGSTFVSHVFPGAARTICYKVVLVNVARGGTTWSSESTVRTATLTESGLAYVWRADVAEGDWENADNWTVYNLPADNACLGYPLHPQCRVRFAAGAHALIHVGRGEFPSILYLDPYGNDSAPGTEIVVRGEGAEVSLLGSTSADGAGGEMRNASLRFERVAVRELDMFDYQIGSATGTNTTLCVADGAVLSMGNSKKLQRMAVLGASNSTWRVESGARVVQGADNPTALLLAAAGESLLLDDAAAQFAGLMFTTPEDVEQRIRLRGPGARLELTRAYFGDKDKDAQIGSPLFNTADNLAPRDIDVVFELPSGGYTNGVPLFSSYAASPARPMGGMLFEESVGKIRLVAAPAALHGHGARSVRQHVVGWKAGIDTDHVELVQGKWCALRFTYGWDDENDIPLDLSEPEAEGDRPTGVFCDAPAVNGTLVILR